MNSRHFLVIVNPASGRHRGQRVLDEVRPIFYAAGARLDVRVCEGPGHANQLASSLDLTQYDGCCVIGGDGTVHEVANGLLRRDEPVSIPLGLIPAGSGNTLHLHLGGYDSHVAARRILTGQTCALDVAKVVSVDQTIYCVNIVGWGAVSDVNCLADKLRVIGPVRYAVASLKFIVNPQPRQARLILDERVVEDEFLLVVGCITKFTGNGMMLAPQAEIDDGMIDVVVVRPTSRWQLLKLFRKVFDGSHLSLPCVELHQVRRFAIELSDQEPLDLDGEAIGGAPFSVNMIPGALRIFT